VPGATKLQSNDSLVIFTDGFVEAVNAAGEEFGDARLIASAQRSVAFPATEMLAAMVRSLDLFVSTTPQHDDITCLLARKI
jgi:sigma-B regulation protein RsbU (phosphoserine phosphatase)